MAVRPSLFGTWAPFGRIGRALGWRWIMPIGTVPLPYNPWLRLALPYIVAAWLLWPVLADGAFHWVRPLVLWLLLALPLSVPILQWAFFALGLPLIQSVLPAAAMLLLAAAVTRGQEPAWLGALTALFFGSHLAGAIGGRWLRRRLLANAARLEAMRPTPGALPMLLLDHDPQLPSADRVMVELGLPTITAVNREGAHRRYLRIAAAAAEHWAERARRAGVVELHEQEGIATIGLPLDGSPARLVRIARDRGSWLERRLVGRLSGMRATGPGGRERYLVGQVAPFMWVPLLPLFITGYFTRGGKPTAPSGFARTKATPLGRRPVDDLALIRLVTGPLRHRGAPAPALADVAAVRAEVDARFEHAVARCYPPLDALIANPTGSALIHFAPFAVAPERIADRADAMVDALARALATAPTLTDQQAEHGVISLARVLSDLPDRALSRIAPRLLPLLADPVMAGGEGWRYAPPGERLTVRAGRGAVAVSDGWVTQLSGLAGFSGFRLLPFAQRLYERLGDLGEPARPTIEALIARYGAVPPLAEARRRLG